MNFNQSALMKALGVGLGVGLVFGIGGVIPVIGTVCCCIGLLVYLAVGASYGYFSQQDGSPVDMATFALGGAIAGAVGGAFQGIISGIAGVVLNLMGVAANSSYGNLSDYGVPEAAAGGLIAIGILCCIGLLIDGVAGAVGGLVYALIRQNQTPTYTPPTPM
jgi:hypothetical protein